MIAGKQIKAARLFLDWSQRDLAEKSDVPLTSIQRLEDGTGSENADRVRNTFEECGIEFLAEDTGGAGGRLKRAATGGGADPQYPARRSVGPEDEDRAGPEAPNDD